MGTDIDKAIRLLVTMQAKKIVDRDAKIIRENVSTATTLWRNQIKRNLSRPYPGGKNMTDTPYMRTGDLRNSVPRFSVTTQKTFNGTRLDTYQTVIKVSRVGKPMILGAFGSSINAWDSYGAELNEWPSALGGWQDRAYEALSEKIDDLLGHNNPYYRY